MTGPAAPPPGSPGRTAPAVRPGTPEDAAAMGRVHVVAWQHAFRGLVPPEVLAASNLRRRTAYWRWRLERADRTPGIVLVATDPADPATVTGFVECAPARDDDLDPALVAEVCTLYVDPACHGTGTGTALLEAGIASAPRACTGAALWCFAGNADALAFLRGRGFAEDGGRGAEDVGGALLEKLRLRRPRAGAHPPEDS